MRASLLLSALLAGGCATDRSGEAPSLLPRPIERRSDALPNVPVPVASPDPALDAEIGALAAKLAAADRAFARALPAARARVRAAGGSAPGTDVWLNAQVSLGALDDPRTDTAGVVSEATRLAIARGTGGLPEYPALTAIEQRAEALRDAQDASIAQLAAQLRR